jgi:plasmid stability protein
MSGQAVLVHLPEPLYERLARRAVRTHRTLEAELVETVRTSLPQEPDELPPDVAEATAATSVPLYAMREGAEALLRDHPALYPVIADAAVKLREHFGPGAVLALERFRDPEAPSAPQELHLVVRTALDPGAARAAMDRFDDAWWFDNMERGEHLLHVTMEFA